MIPFPAHADYAPLDISYLFASERPAGNHGFLTAKGDHFVFEDGTPVRFWGTNLNGGACFPEHEYAEKLAKRLAAYGVNLVRLHQMDAEWATPSLYQFAKGKRMENTSTYDPESFDRLDYLLSCLKKEGIYVYLDMLTYRKFKESDGVENAVLLTNRGAPYCIFDEKLISLQQEYCKTMWEHINPYTGIAYKDEPQIALSGVANEVSLFGSFNQKIDVEPYTSRFRASFAQWLEARGCTQVDPMTVDLNTLGVTPELDEYKTEVQSAYYNGMIDYMRSLGVRIPITGLNFSWKWAECKSIQGVGDFKDSHLNVRAMKWNPGERYYRDISLHEKPEWTAVRNARMREFGKPFFTSEWDLTYPDKYRAESSILYAAVGCLQDWSGFAIHTYAYTSHLRDMDILGKEIHGDCIGGVGYREGIFSTWNDPAKFGLFYHAALITRRGDVRPAEKCYTVAVKKLDKVASDGKPMAYTVAELNAMGAEPDDTNTKANKLTPTSKKAFLAATEQSRIAADYLDQVPDAVPEDQPIVDLSAGEVRSDTGELFRSWKKRFGTVDTPMTKAVYGRLDRQGTISMNGMTVECSNDYAVIAISSLNNALDLEHSDSMLLTTVGNVENTEQKSSLAPRSVQPRDGGAPYLKMDEFGKAPILCEVIDCRVRLKTARKDLIVWAVNSEGIFLGNIPVTYDGDWAVMEFGRQYPSVYYLIQAE